jgi:general secretion pathway protein K
VCAPRSRGVALLGTVVALAVMTVLATSLARTSAVDAHLARTALATLQADALARSGVAAATALLGGNATRIDSLHAPWARDAGPQPLGAGVVRVRVEDEARRLDLGTPELAAALPALLGALGLDTRLADAIADWTDADDVARPHGAERAWYLARTPQYVAANAPLRTVGELRLVRGIDAAALARLRPHVTVAGERAVNPNTASQEVLVALAGPAAAARVLAARREAPLARESFASFLPDVPARRLTDRGSLYRVTAIGEVGTVRRAIEVTVRAPAGLEAEVMTWRPIGEDASRRSLETDARSVGQPPN